MHNAVGWGTPQRRRRLAVVADFAGLLAPTILFDGDPRTEPRSEVQSLPESVCGDSEAGDTEESGIEDAEDFGGRADLPVGTYTFRNFFDGQLFRESTKTLDCSGGGGNRQPMIFKSPRTRVYGFPLGFRPENVRLYEETATTLCNGTRPGFTNAIVMTGEKEDD